MSETDTEVIPKLCKYIYSNSQEKVAFHEVRPQSMMQPMHAAVHEVTLGIGIAVCTSVIAACNSLT